MTEEAGQSGGERLARVVLIGAESTGKTTLAARLAAYYDTVWVPEYLRTFVDQKGALPEPSDTRLIVQGHLDQDAALAAKARRVLFYDTDLLSTCIYTRYYFGACPDWVERLAAARSPDLYLFTDIDIPWTPDPGQRDGPAVREELHILFQRALSERGLRHVHLSGTPRQRMEAAVRAVDGLLGRG